VNYIIETERLQLRPFVLNDATFVIQLLNSDGWLKYIGDRNVHNTTQAEQYLQNGLMLSYEVNGYGLWLVQKKDSKLPLGMCGILKRETLHLPDIGFAFLPEFTGLGYALEAAKASLHYAMETLGLKEIAAITLAGNEKSVKLLTKLGMQNKGPFYLPDSTEELQLFNIKKTSHG